MHLTLTWKTKNYQNHKQYTLLQICMGKKIINNNDKINDNNSDIDIDIDNKIKSSKR